MATKEPSEDAETRVVRRKGLTRNVVPDKFDIRDRLYLPTVKVIPGMTLDPAENGIPVLDQGSTSACTGFALASMVHHLQRQAQRPSAQLSASPYMLYSMARRYDEFPGVKADTGSSLRGAMKGWFKHGACSADLWETLEMPTGPLEPSKDWWLDAVKRPLGAYYRVERDSITDMHVALNEIGIIFASAECHSGWDEGMSIKKKDQPSGSWWKIPAQKAGPADGGHAFVILGYNQDGFIIQNSWGPEWGTRGRAVLTYQDWIDNSMDCWVAQLGVVTELHTQLAQSSTLRLEHKKVKLAGDPTLRNREIDPFIVDMENNGMLSNTGEFRTLDSDLDTLVTHHIDAARERWKLGPSDPIDIAIYAHGGLTKEKAAAQTAARWIPTLYDSHIFPIFLMWETGLWDTLKNRLSDAIEGAPKPTAGPLERLSKWWNKRLERLLAAPGTVVWGEMKQNADAISSNKQGGGRKLYTAFDESKRPYNTIRIHLIGHSAGAIVHSHIIKRLHDWEFESVTFMAPAATMNLFDETVLPAIKTGRVKQYRQFHLTDPIEQDDSTCRPILGYGRSLLYLVSQSFEHGLPTKILGLQKDFEDNKNLHKLKNVQAWSTPTTDTPVFTHGGFDDDEKTMKKVISLIQSTRK